MWSIIMEPACISMSLLCKSLHAGFIRIKFNEQFVFQYNNSMLFVGLGNLCHGTLMFYSLPFVLVGA